MGNSECRGWMLDIEMVLVLSGVYYSYVKTQYSPVEGLNMNGPSICTETQCVWQDQDDLLLETSEL